MPEFAQRHSEREAEKTARLEESIASALQRRPAPRQADSDYTITPPILSS